MDLWGGYRNCNIRAPWEQDTIVNVFSTTKGVASLAIALAASRGMIDYDAKVVDYWPEFGQNGKGAITVRQAITPDRLYGRVNATIRFVAGGAMPVGALLGGLLGGVVGLPLTLVIAELVAIVCARS